VLLLLVVLEVVSPVVLVELLVGSSVVEVGGRVVVVVVGRAVEVVVERLAGLRPAVTAG
jgi:hypothetical protein